MSSSLVNTFRVCFYATCIVTVTFMVGYWFYKSEYEDRDIGVVDYKSFEQAKDVQFPIPYLCFLDPFLKKKFNDTDLSINATTYTEYLTGERFNESFQNIDYQNMTLDLNDYFLSASEKFLNESEFRDSNLSFIHKEIFSGIFYNGYFAKCFSFENELKENHHIQKISLQYNKTKLLDDLGGPEESEIGIYYNIYYPEQFLLQLSSPYKLSMTLSHYYLTLWVDDLELLKRRSSRNKQCTETENSFDELVLSKHVETVGCRAPYIGSQPIFPICDTQEQIMEGKYEYKDVRNKYYPKACVRTSKLGIHAKATTLPKDSYVDDWNLMIIYPEEVRLITQSKEIDVHTLIGNIGAYIGLFLGCALIQIPDFVLSLYGYLCGNMKSEHETRQSSKKEMKGNPKYRPELIHHVDPKFRSCKDEAKCNDKGTTLRNQISPIENSCAARLDKIEKIIYGHLE